MKKTLLLIAAIAATFGCRNEVGPGDGSDLAHQSDEVLVAQAREAVLGLPCRGVRMEVRDGQRVVDCDAPKSAYELPPVLKEFGARARAENERLELAQEPHAGNWSGVAAAVAFGEETSPKAITSGQADFLASQDLTCGQGPWRVRPLEFTGQHPETVRKSPFWGTLMISVLDGATMEWNKIDGRGLLRMTRTDGTTFNPFTHDGDLAFPIGSGDPGYASQIGDGYVSSPLGFTEGAFGDIYVTDMGDTTIPDGIRIPQTIWVAGPYGNHVGYIPLPTTGINDCVALPLVDLGNGQVRQDLLCTDSNFRQDYTSGLTVQDGGHCEIIKITGANEPSTATVTTWLSTSQLSCYHANPIDLVNLSGQTHVVFATLGELSPTFAQNGGVYVVPILSNGQPGTLRRLKAPNGLYDAVTTRVYTFGGSTTEIIAGRIFEKDLQAVKPSSNYYAPGNDPYVLFSFPGLAQFAGAECWGNPAIPGSFTCAIVDLHRAGILAKRD